MSRIFKDVSVYFYEISPPEEFYYLKSIMCQYLFLKIGKYKSEVQSGCGLCGQIHNCKLTQFHFYKSWIISFRHLFHPPTPILLGKVHFLVLWQFAHTPYLKHKNCTYSITTRDRVTFFKGIYFKRLISSFLKLCSRKPCAFIPTHIRVSHLEAWTNIG